MIDTADETCQASFSSRALPLGGLLQVFTKAWKHGLSRFNFF